MPTERSFGRRYAPDARDANFAMRRVLDPLREKYFPKGIPEGHRSYREGPRRDQGQTGTCAGHGVTARIESGPVMQPLPQHLTPFDMYRRAVLIDEFPDNDFEATLPDAKLQMGTSVRGVLKVGQALGCFPMYLWAQSVEDVRAWHMAGFGGVILGISWRSGMMQTDSDGFINYTGQEEGGHCVDTFIWNDHVKHHGKLTRATRIQNSWGEDWGQGGNCWISQDDLAKVLADQGEAGAPTEVKVKAA